MGCKPGQTLARDPETVAAADRTVLRREALATGLSLVALLQSAPAFAKQGEFAKSDFGSAELSAGQGEVTALGAQGKWGSFTTGKDVTPRMKAINDRWSEMVVDVRKAMTREKPAYTIAKTAIADNMKALKSEIRSVYRDLSDGQIAQDQKDITGAGSFDYGKGRYILKPIGQKAEDVFFEMANVDNSCDPGTRKPANKAIADLDKAEGLYKEWLALVAEEQSKRG